MPHISKHREGSHESFTNSSKQNNLLHFALRGSLQLKHLILDSWPDEIVFEFGNPTDIVNGFIVEMKNLRHIFNDYVSLFRNTHTADIVLERQVVIFLLVKASEYVD